MARLGDASGVFTLGEEGPATGEPSVLLELPGAEGKVVGRGGRRTGVPGLDMLASTEVKSAGIGTVGGEVEEDAVELPDVWLPKLISLDVEDDDAADVESLGGGKTKEKGMLPFGRSRATVGKNEAGGVAATPVSRGGLGSAIAGSGLRLTTPCLACLANCSLLAKFRLCNLSCLMFR